VEDGQACDAVGLLALTRATSDLEHFFKGL